MREAQAKAKREEWIVNGSSACLHTTMTLLFTEENTRTGDYVCIQCGERGPATLQADPRPLHADSFL
jgi:hypothetical protein